jgi:LysM repeat protein
MSKLFSDYLNESDNAPSSYLTEAEKLNADKSFVPKNYSVTDFEQDASVQVAFDKVTDYLSEHRGLGSALIDQATIGKQTDIPEFMRDDVARIGSPINKATILKDAPEDVKAAYRLMQDRFNAAELSGVGEWASAIGDYGADVLFNPETIGVLGTLFTAPATGGASAVAGVGARKVAQQGARSVLANAIKATKAANTSNPYKAVAGMGSIYGGAGAHVAQELDLAIGQKDEYSLAETGLGVGVGALSGMGLYAAGSKIGNKYFRAASEPRKEPSKEVGAALYDEALDGEFIPSSGNAVISEALRLSGPEGATAKVVSGNDSLNAAAKKFADDLGGGEKTREEILRIIRAAADAEETAEGVTSRVKQGLHTIASNLSGNFFGKAAGVLSPIAKLSGTAAQLQKKLSYEFGIKFKVQDTIVEKDLSEVQREVTGKFNDRFRAIVEDISLHSAKGTLAEDMNAALMLSVRSSKPLKHKNFDAATNKAINSAAAGVKSLYADMGVQLQEIGVIDELVENYVPRMWSRSAIEKNKKGLMDLFQSKGKMTKGDARRTVDSMLDVQNQVDTGGSGGYFFSAKRKLNDLGDDADFQEFLNDDILGSLHAYTFQAGKSIAKHRVLGVNNFDQFKGFYINRIRKELEEKGETFSPKQEKQIEMLYRTATGEGLDRYGKTAQDVVDTYSFVNRVSMLGLATLSSLTEVFLNIGKAGVRNSVKGLGEAIEFSFKGVTKDLETKLVTNHGLTVKEAMSEMRQFSIHVDQAMAQVGDRLSGDALVNERLQNASNKFFRLNMLDQWTKFVQATSFASGKHMISDNIAKLASHGNRKLDKNMQVRAGELAELGIDYKKAVDWHKAGAKTDSDFYKTNILGGVARYTNSIVLQPTAMSGLKPLLYSNPKTAILFQLLSYPAAFTNTVLKGAAKSLTKAPVRNGAKLIPAALIMTGMSRWTNYLRTNGESERGKDLDEVLYNSVARWGGNGLLLDSFNRAKTSAKYSGSALSYATLPFGPASSDALNLIQQGIIPTLGGKVPVLSGTYMGKTLIGEKDVIHYRRSLRKAQEDIFGGLIPEFDKEVPAAGFVAGGLVKIGAKAITTTASDLMGNKLGTLGPKIASKKPVEFNDEVAENLSKATDNYFNEDTLNLTSARISEGLEELEMEGVLDFYNLSHLEFVDAMVHSEIKKDIKSIEELEKLPEWKKAIESTNEKEAITNWANAQKAMGYTKEHRKALRIIQQNKNKVDPEGTIEYMVPDMVRSLKQAYNKVKINVTPEEVAAAQKQKFDDPTFNNLHDFISSSARMRMDTLSEMGGDKIAENVLIKLAAEGDINFSTFKAPKIKDTVDDKYPELLSANERLAAIKKYREKSIEPSMVFRTETSFQEAQSFLAFSFAREIGVHVGTEGAATTIAIRGLPNTKAKQEFKLAADAKSLTRERSGEMFGNPDLLKEEEAVLSSTTRIEDDMPIDEYGYFGGEAVEREELLKIKPITMNAGYIDVRNPLLIETDLPGWEAERILTPGGGWDEYFEPEIARRGIKLTNKQQSKLAELTKRSEEFEGLFLDPPVGEATDIVGFYRQELKRNQINTEFRNLLEGLGFDSIKYNNEVEQGFVGEAPYSYILFKPQQFKSVTARAFDPKDSRHGAAKGGYIVKGGDTLSQIALDQGVALEEIARLNEIENIDVIFEGQELKLSEKTPDMFTAQAEEVKKVEPIKEIEKAKESILIGLPEKATNIKDVVVEKARAMSEAGESTLDTLSDVSKDVQRTVLETFDDVKETVSSATGRTLSALKKLVSSDFSSRGRTAENTAGTTAEPKTTSVMGDMTMEQVREANTPDAPDLSDVKMPDVDFSSEGRTAENTAGTTEEPKEIKLPAIEFKPRDIEIESEKQMEDQESLVDTLKGFYNASQSQVAKNLIAFFNPLAGDKTEEDYNPQVVEALGFAAANALKKNKSTIDYGDYNLKESNVRAQVGSAAQRKRDNLVARMKSGDITPTEEAAFSVGGGGVTVEGDKVYVTDTYDFSKLERQINSVLPDEYAKLRDWISKYKGNEFKSKIFVGTLKDLGL